MFCTFKKVAPKASATERTALEAGSVSWDGELFSGSPVATLLDFKDDGLSDEAGVFRQPVLKAAGMCNAWDIAQRRPPQELWDYLKEGFFGDYSEEYGGLGFSAKAQSTGCRSFANETLMVTVGVPNSLGPGELLLKYAPKAERPLPAAPSRWSEIPASASPAPAQVQMRLPSRYRRGVRKSLMAKVRLNFEKRWITLAPIATVVGLAFRLFDPTCWATKKIGHYPGADPRDTQGMDIAVATTRLAARL